MSEELARRNELAQQTDELDPYMRRQMDLALMKARDIEGTMLNDLESAMNLVKRYKSAMRSVGLPDPYDQAANDLLVKYKMKDAPRASKPKRTMQQELEVLVGEVVYDADADEIGPELPRGTE